MSIHMHYTYAYICTHTHLHDVLYTTICRYISKKLYIFPGFPLFGTSKFSLLYLLRKLKNWWTNHRRIPDGQWVQWPCHEPID